MRSFLIRSALLLVAGSAAAQSGPDEAWALCRGGNATQPPDQVIAGCSWLIESGTHRTRETAVAYAYRASARFRRGDLAGAVEDYDAAIHFDRHNPAFWISRGALRRV